MEYLASDHVSHSNPQELVTRVHQYIDYQEQVIGQLTAKNLHQLTVIDEQSNRLQELELAADSVTSEISKLRDIAAGATKLAEQKISLEQRVKRLEMQLKVEKDRVKELKDTQKEFKNIGATPAKIRALIKSHKDRSAERLAECSSWKAEVVSQQRQLSDLKHQVKVAGMYRLSSFGDYHLMVWPHQVSKGELSKPDKVNKRENEELGVLCVHRSGNAKLMYLFEDELTSPDALKGGFKPPKEAKELAESWLLTMKKQNWKVTPQDIAALNNE